MDTCCFAHYCNGEVRREFNYLEIREHVIKKNLCIIITPYTLYECFQDCVTSERIADIRDELFRAGPFWVLNVNHLIGENIGLEFGYDFIAELKFGNPPYERKVISI